MRENLGQQVMGPTITLAAQAKKVLEADPEALLVKASYGNFYVSAIELRFYGGGESEIVGYLAPDEGEGSTFDFYTPKQFKEEKS